ncbi:integrase [Alphaproteobacteria bacterium]|nr:integrase [Alphaproteobacteria bacterium]
MKYIWNKTNTMGVRYREHPTRKHGVRKDRYYTIRYKLDGKGKEEALGWESQGWTEKKAAARLSELRESHRTGVGEATLADKRKAAQEKAKRDEELNVLKEKEQITFGVIFEKYMEQSHQDKELYTCKTEEGMYNKWLKPMFENTPMKDISPFHLEKLKKDMSDANLAPRTIQYMLALIRQVFNYAHNFDLYSGDNPTSKVKKPSEDNRRSRFLSHEEANMLLEALNVANSITVHDMSLLSLHCGLRAGEIFNLTWNDVDFRNKSILIKDTKSGRNRNAVMTDDVKSMLERRKRDASSDLVFKSKKGERIEEVSNTFARTVEALGFNSGIKDRRQKVVFHTLRHTYASWLVMSEVDLYTVQKLMGHSTISMTERYSHLAPDHFKKAVSMLEGSIKQHKENNLVSFEACSSNKR